MVREERGLAREEGIGVERMGFVLAAEGESEGRDERLRRLGDGSNERMGSRTVRD